MKSFFNWRKCIKCGSTGANFQIRYRKAGDQQIIAGHVYPGTAEHILVICQRCGYEWHEPTKDHGRKP